MTSKDFWDRVKEYIDAKTDSINESIKITLDTYPWADLETWAGLGFKTNQGWTGGHYDPATGIVYFDSIDGLEFHTTDLRGATGADGAKGDPGPKGDTGSVGPKGDIGATGPKGDKGDPGADGAGVTISGSDTEANIRAKIGSLGEMWLISEPSNPNDGHGLVWDVANSNWNDVGPIRGPIGNTGPQGAKGDPGVAGPQGIQGPKGDKGDKGDTGDTGPSGAPDATGKKGCEVGTDGSAADATQWNPIRTNPIVLSEDYVLQDGVSATAASGFTIADTKTLTIPDGSVFSVV